jgi:hypothetical protein
LQEENWFDGGFSLANMSALKPLIHFKIEEAELISMRKGSAEAIQYVNEEDDPMGYSLDSIVA